MNILLVEDSDNDALLIENALKGSHQYANIQRAKSLSECISNLEKGGVDMVLLDLGLPDTTGVHSLAEIVAVNRTMPIVIITGDDRRESIKEAVEYGAKDYIVKNRMNEKRIVDAVAYIRREIERGNKLQRGRRIIEDSLATATQNATDILNGNYPNARTNN